MSSCLGDVYRLCRNSSRGIGLKMQASTGICTAARPTSLDSVLDRGIQKKEEVASVITLLVSVGTIPRLPLKLEYDAQPCRFFPMSPIGFDISLKPQIGMSQR
ncbi:hypothetical protein EYR41_006776 [Orbilia oligospora]|uniref:Uncharacterized protein n=1 Tax=Orbilia oligospora TaxID=2813651 RepID=A0A7C8PYK4_ORBOL|nr:hypothetical protein TWF751_000182 [Orbilia oligospora]TGJ67663.1 hypothetical protein EYR41_006776 [Orbilia oligospora]